MILVINLQSINHIIILTLHRPIKNTSQQHQDLFPLKYFTFIKQDNSMRQWNDLQKLPSMLKHC